MNGTLDDLILAQYIFAYLGVCQSCYLNLSGVDVFATVTINAVATTK